MFAEIWRQTRFGRYIRTAESTGFLAGTFLPTVLITQLSQQDAANNPKKTFAFIFTISFVVRNKNYSYCMMPKNIRCSRRQVNEGVYDSLVSLTCVVGAIRVFIFVGNVQR